MARSGVRLEVNPFFGFAVDVRTLVRDDKSSSFNMICDHDPVKDEDHDPCGVSNVTTCKVCGNTDRSTFKQGRIQSDSTVLLFDGDDVADAKAGDEDAKRILRVSAHPVEEVMARAVGAGKPYVLVPAKGSEAAYSIFTAAMEASPDRALLLTYAYSSLTKLYSLKVLNGRLAIEQLCWPEDMAELPDVPEPADPASKDVLQAGAILDAMLDDFDPDAYRDTRRQKVQQMIAQAQGVPGAVVEQAAGKPRPQQDLSGALDAALQAALAAKQAKQASSTATGKAPAKTAAKKTTAKKEPAKA